MQLLGKMRVTSLLIGFVVLSCFAWLGSASDNWRNAYSFSGEKNEYYALLAHGFQHGHLYMDVKVDPRYFSTDPKERHNASTLLDTSLYRGHYYLYFGVVPAAFIFLPYHLLTGSDVSGNAAAFFLVGAGFLAYWWIYAQTRVRYFANITFGQEAAATILIGFGAGTPVLLMAGSFYDIAIAAGYLGHALMWLGLFNAWHAKEGAGKWLGFASLAAGLAVGCRPTFVFALPVVAVACVFMARRGGSPRALAVWAVLPAAFVGLALAEYNYARFGSPFEFGLKYCEFTAMIGGGFPFYRASFFWSNLQWYYLRPPALSIYFPYLSPMNASIRPAGYYGYELMQGELVITVLAAFTLSWSWVRPPRIGSGMRLQQGLLALGFVLMYLDLGFFGARSTRYLVDFQASLVFLIALAAGHCASRDVHALRSRSRIWRMGFVLFAIAGAASNILTSLQVANRFEYVRPKSWALLSHYGSFPSVALERLGLLHYGPIRFRVIFPHFKGHPNSRPLLSTGLPNYTDVLYVNQYAENLVELELTHNGYGSVRSKLIHVDTGCEYAVDVDMGSLYPPRNNPWFQGWGDNDIETLKTAAIVKFNGVRVIDQRLRFYDSPPNWVFFGRNPAGIDPSFEGRILEPVLLPPRRPSELRIKTNESGVWRLSVTFPFETPYLGQPILASGTAGRGNLLMLKTAEDHSIQFGIDQWGLDFLGSPSVPIAKDGPHSLEIFVGPQFARGKLPSEWHLAPNLVQDLSSTIRIWLDGQPVWTTQITINKDSYGFVTIGSNPQGFSVAAADFSGSIASQESSPDDIKAFAERNLKMGPGR